MGLLVLNRLMSIRRPRRRRFRRAKLARKGLIATSAKRKYSSCQQDDDDDSRGGKSMRKSEIYIPEDILCHIYSLMPMRDAARAACVSRAFLSSWRCHPKLTFNENTLGLRSCGLEKHFIRRVDDILEKHSGIGLKTFKLLQFPDNLDICDHVDRWLQFAMTPAIEELTVIMYEAMLPYNFPCSLLSNGIANSIRSLVLGNCAFHPTVELASWRSLKKLCLSWVCITGPELGCLLSNSFVLEWLELKYCKEIVSLKIPCTLQRLSYLDVFQCKRLRFIKNKAPNLTTFYLSGYNVNLSFGEWSQVKKLRVCDSRLVRYASDNLPSMMPNLETLSIDSFSEVVNATMLTSKFLCLKFLNISLSGLTFSPSYDYFCLASFFDASPFLETFFLSISQQQMEHESKSIVGDFSHMRQIAEHRHEYLKSVVINGFCYSKSLVELTCHILENLVSLEYLTLNTALCFANPFKRRPGLCVPMENKGILKEVPKVLLAIQTYIARKVPSTVRLNVVEPCRMCKAIMY
ncbi:putative F-box/FBD/LRR-repeat protein At5g56810 [Oryza brachyantha]|uniref:putative F-box/FBD/LRR-repeat protein At5g56810 n=1 Tax=Oryza brachyantha TaxID=4533 RepID=UPI0003EACAAE|nr:putative F-box/FBD/LRR-repeat protein At5g56810 [Oryza brachyantha]